MPEQQLCTYADCSRPAAISPAGMNLLSWRCREHTTLAPDVLVVQQPTICATRGRLAVALREALDTGRYIAAYDREQWVAGRLDTLEREGGI